jgi:hypothetical protein
MICIHAMTALYAAVGSAQRQWTVLIAVSTTVIVLSSVLPSLQNSAADGSAVNGNSAAPNSTNAAVCAADTMFDSVGLG